MVAVIDYKGTVPAARGVAGIRPYLFQLISEPFLFARESYGEELTLHFGHEVEVPLPRGLVAVEGTHVLCLRASVWWLKSAPLSSFVSSEEFRQAGAKQVTLTELEANSIITPGERIVRIDLADFHGEGWPGGIEMGLKFSDNSYLKVQPRYDPEQPMNELADWELFTPYKRCLRVGPGLDWVYAPSDEIEGGASFGT